MNTKDFAYIALDVETAGPNPHDHPTLSIGACLVDSPHYSFEERQKRGHIFYAELVPNSFLYEEKAMRVGASHLECLENLRQEDPRYDSTHPGFYPIYVLEYMEQACEMHAIDRFADWIEKVRDGREAVGITDTVFFDSVRIAMEFGRWVTPSPFGHKGLDLYSMYRGRANDARASLKDFTFKMGITDTRTKPHKADQDASFTADIAWHLLFTETT